MSREGKRPNEDHADKLGLRCGSPDSRPVFSPGCMEEAMEMEFTLAVTLDTASEACGQVDPNFVHSERKRGLIGSL